MMKKLLLITLFVPIFSFSQTWQWAKGIKGNGQDYGEGIAKDASGNIYYTGTFSSDSVTFGTYTLKRTGVEMNAFITKYDSTGNVLWAKTNTVGDAEGECIAIDNAGNIVVSGRYFSQYFSLGLDTLSMDTVINLNAVSTIFIAKYDQVGNVLWDKNTKSTNQDQSFSIATDQTNNVYITGTHVGPISVFGTDTIHNTGWSLQDFFLAKYNAAGSFLWVKNADSAVGNSVATDNSGNVLVTGHYFCTSAVFGTHSIPGTLGDQGIFLVKYDSLGNVLWAKRQSGGGNEVTTDAYGNIYTAGYLKETMIIGTDTLKTDPSYAKIFLAKYDTLGNPVWAKGYLGNGGFSVGFSVAIDASGNIYLTSGTQASSITFGAFTLQLPVLPFGIYYMCITKHDSVGAVLCATAIPGGGNGGSAKLAVDDFGHAYIGGYFGNDPFVIGNNTLNLGSGGVENIFIAKVLMDCSSSPACIPAISYTLTPDTAPHTWDVYPTYLSNTASARWYWGDGSSTVDFYPSHTYSIAGNYNICVTVYSACGDSTQACQNDSVYRYSNNSTASNMVYVNVLHSQTTGINKIENSNELAIYPNPAQNNFTIETTNTQKQTLQLFDVNGKLILSQIINSKTTVDVSNLNSGIYNISITSSIHTVNKKLAIVR